MNWRKRLNNLKICFIGIGSIAKRHIKNLMKIADSSNTDIVIDAVCRGGKRRKESVFESIRKVSENIDDLNEIYDAVFITNPTQYHVDTLKEVTPYGKNFFIEKPIVSLDKIEDAERYIEKKDSVYYVACPLRYNAVIQYIKNIIKKDKIISVRSISSSYLPEWRPDQDYRETYSAHKSLGGGVSIDLIHEWDYLTYLFGFPDMVKCMKGKKSNLEIDSEDYAIYIAEYVDKIVEVHLDYFGRKPIREIVLITDNDTIIGDILGNKVQFLKSGKTVEFNEKRDDFQIRELKHFLRMIEEKQYSSDIRYAVRVLRLTQGDLFL